MVNRSRVKHRAFLLLLSLFLMMVHPALSASAAITQEDGDLFLSCRADNDCVLTPTPIGEEQVSGQTFASLVQPEVLTFEFLSLIHI